MLPLAQMPAPQLPDLPAGPSLDSVRGPVKIPLFETWQIIAMSIGGFVVLSLIIWLIIFLIRRQGSKTKPADPRATALNAIKAAAQNSEDDGHFAQLTSAALRRFYEKALSISTAGHTTQEFFAELSSASTDQTEADALLKEFIYECDQIKFAQKQLTQSEREDLSKTASQIVTLCSERKEPAQS